MNLQDDDFTLFGLPAQFALDRSALDERWRQLQGQVQTRTSLRPRGLQRSAWPCSGPFVSTRLTGA